MALRQVSWAVAAGVWVLGSLSLLACSDGSSATLVTEDAGRGTTDSGTSNDAGAQLASAMCGEVLCEGRMLGSFPVAGCCFDDGVCGSDFDMVHESLGGALPLKGCLQSAAPGEPNTAVCGAAFDALDSVANEQLDLEVPLGDAPLVLSFDPCCTPRGVCGVEADSVQVGPSPFPIGLGCQEFTEILAAVPAGGTDAGAMDAGIDDSGGLDGGDVDAGAPASDPLDAIVSGAAPLPFCQPGAPTVPACLPGAVLPGNLEVTADLCAFLGLPTPSGAANDPGDCISLSEFGQDIPPDLCGCGESVTEAPDVEPMDGQPDCLVNIATEVCGCP